MISSQTTISLKNKILKILFLLLLVRLGLYIPIPNIDLDIFTQGQNVNSMFGLAKTLTGISFLGIGSLGILPYINSSIIIQLLTSVVPSLEKLQKEEGSIGRQKLNRYTRYLTFIWAIIFSTAIAFFFVKPLTFDWNNFVALKIILSLTTGSLLSMWFAELITEESLGNGSSMIIFINIIGSIPSTFKEFTQKIQSLEYTNVLYLLGQATLLYFLIVLTIVLFQDAYKKINIISAKQLNLNYTEKNSNINELKNSYIPIKLNQGGIMPLVFSSTIASFLYYPLQIFSNSNFGKELQFLPLMTTLAYFTINIFLVIFFSNFYSLLVLKPNDISENLAKMAYNIPAVRQGTQTTEYLKQTISRLAFLGGIFLAFLAFFPIILGNIFEFNVFKNVTSLLILVGVITDVTAQIRGYLISRNYEGFKKV